ncbi:hypothetical protein AB0J80_27835 [Actinoplanes sp. NPDC049548]|uniref:hypothetical protein n=1 Tax=Actinoplanes sp. NPDC049548 TaxID=3155152 RepID=UPI00341DBEDB
MDDRFVDVWDALDDDERSLLLEQRHAWPVPAPVAAILIKVGWALEPQPGLFPAPVHWPIGFRDFLDDVAAVRGDDDECE